MSAFRAIVLQNSDGSRPFPLADDISFLGCLRTVGIATCLMKSTLR